MTKILGLDPGLRATGWGIIEAKGSHIAHIADGVIKSPSNLLLPERLMTLSTALENIIEHFHPDEAAVEQVFVNKNPDSTLKLGMARGVVLLMPARYDLPIGEYPANLVKKSIVGSGHADKTQIEAMIKMLLPKAQLQTNDAADALAVAICHHHHLETRNKIGGTMAGSWAG